MPNDSWEVTQQPNGPEGAYATVAQVQAIEQRTLHTDREVSQIRATLSGIEATMSQFMAQDRERMQAINKLADRINRPKTFNIWAMISAVVVTLGALAYYVELNLRPLRENVIELRDRDEKMLSSLSAAGRLADDGVARTKNLAEIMIRAEDDVTEIWHDVHDIRERLRSNETRTEAVEIRGDRRDQQIERIIEQLADVRERAAAAEVSRRAIGDYVRDIDRLGSRRWIDQPKTGEQ